MERKDSRWSMMVMAGVLLASLACSFPGLRGGQQASSGSGPTATYDPGAHVQYRSATITFDLTQIAFTGTQPLAGTNQIWVQNGHCWPPTVPAGGNGYFVVEGEDPLTLTGLCAYESSDTVYSSFLTGQYDIYTNQINFELKTEAKFKATEDGTNYSEHTVVFTGSTTASNNVANGSAGFTSTCNAHGSVNCIEDFQDLQYTGTVPFTLTLIPCDGPC